MERPADRDALPDDVTFAVHTRICTFLLDDAGVCRVVLTPTGMPAPGADRCVGAQFVACLDMLAAEPLVGELKLGTNLLLTRSEGGRFVLLRTPPIIWVEEREPGASIQRAQALPLPTVPLPRPPPRRTFESSASGPPPPPSRTFESSVSGPPPPPPRTFAASTPLPPPSPLHPPEPTSRELSDLLETDPSIEIEDMVTFSEITLTFPLYRPDGPDEGVPAPPPSRSAFSRGQRLR